MADLLYRDVTDRVIGVFYDTYNELGHGFPEFVYRRALTLTLGEAGFHAEEEVFLPVFFHGRRIAKFQADIVVSRVLIIEVKVLPAIERRDQAQVLHYLKASGLPVGLVLNFGPNPCFKRVVFATARQAQAAAAAAKNSPGCTGGVPAVSPTQESASMGGNPRSE